MKDIWVYDIEVAPNLFTAVFLHYRDSSRGLVFEKSEREDNTDELIQFLADKPMLMGYNNHDYDDVVLAGVVDGMSNRQIYNLSKKLIESDDDTRYSLIRKHKLQTETIDLIRMLFSKKLRVSLKSLMVTLKWEKLQDLPFAPQDKIPTEKIDDVLDYNANDVAFTRHLAHTVRDELNLRVEIEKRYGRNVMSKDGVATGIDLLLALYCEKTGHKEDQVRKGRTTYENLRLRDCIVPSVEFKSKEFAGLLERYMNQEDLTLSEKVNYNGKIYSYGIGGLHTEDEGGVFIADDTEVYIDADVRSYYPSILIHYVLFPSHLGNAFTHVYKQIFDQRVAAKAKGDKLESETLKLALNGSFGNLRNSYSYLYDEKVFFTITVSGQLMLSMLCEMLDSAGFTVISANTDGVTARVKKKRYKEYVAICKEWEKKTGMMLEYTLFNRLYRRDVNCYYHAVCDRDGKETGEVKEKGGWVRKTKLGKGFDKPIVQKALYEYFINGTPPADTILNHKDIYDFCSSQRVGKQFKVEWGGKPTQRINRYYITNSKDGGELMKIKEDGSKTSLVAGYPVMLFNDFVTKEDYQIDYSYYISEVNKIISSVEHKQYSLFE